MANISFIVKQKKTGVCYKNIMQRFFITRKASGKRLF